ncbi:helix-turn-helix transcriptional regulator [Sphingomonas sanxanigenens]|uniref:HTH luxR-type domain-containing protein n=1 Tax=Sphingomonas sanxanigenens DSM 19645 = NX02 TaxID=1123269 RepID=W0ACF7_9SPHN|nr:helix-turn-helix transcriptional regulator [Sphingomonas sanxanigenens]AHE54227.1 hypothetical protein NX02_12645 [Sphingomonas sanxanigenens DSM 19645 = NX02]
MALSRTDENELLTALHEGMHDQPLWQTFLLRLRARTRADYASLIFRQGDAPMHRATQLFAGRDVRAEAERLAELATLDPIRYDRLRPGRVYSPEEMIDPADMRHDRFRREYMERIGVRYGRFMRVTEPGGSSLWVVISRQKEDFGAADAALVGSLAPHLGIALRNFLALEQARFRINVAEDALRRAGIGWRALDGDGRVLAGSGAEGVGRRLHVGSVEADRAVTRAAHAFAAHADHPPEAIDLDTDDGARIIAVPVPEQPLAALALPALVALSRSQPPIGPHHVPLLAKLHGLAIGEARLALLLADGHSLAEAAPMLGLTIETARNYSKRLYAKTATRGQADLVRLVLTSVAVLG